ncbi:cytospin-A-like [Ptychodera flava]|uniref:cytospin-A-like n=1 Tax=Ptychodera flava TaxID=63121 RepID=UPI003969C797
MKKSFSNYDTAEQESSELTSDDRLILSGYSNQNQVPLSRSFLSKSQEDLIGSVRRRSSSTSSKQRPRSTLGIPKGSDYYEDFPELTVTKENRSGSQTNIARSRVGFHNSLRGCCSYENIIDSSPERLISPSPSESQIHRRGYSSQERFLRLSREDLNGVRFDGGASGSDSAITKREKIGNSNNQANKQSSSMAQNQSGADGWSEIQNLLQKTQLENNSMKQQIEQLMQENQLLKEKIQDGGGGANHERRTDSEKAFLLNIDSGSKGKGSTVSSTELSPKEKGSIEALTPEPVSENGHQSAYASVSDDVFVADDRAGMAESTNWEVQSIRSEGSVACLQDRIHQMEETHHSVNEELQATLQELEDMQESVGDLTFENDRLMEEKGILLEALCSQTEKLHRSRAEVEFLKSALEANNVVYDSDAFDETYISDKSQIEQQILDLMTNQAEECEVKGLFRDLRNQKEYEHMIASLREKNGELEATLESVITEKMEIEKNLNEHKSSSASDQLEMERLKTRIQHERAQTSEILQSSDKPDFAGMLENIEREKDMLETEKADLEEALAKSKNENSKLCNTIAKLEEESEKDKTLYNHEIMDLKEEIKRVTSEKAELETEIVNLKDSLEEMDIECERHLAEKQQDAATINELQLTIKSMKQYKQDLERTMNDVRRKSARDEDEWRQFQADLQTAVVIANDIRNEAQEELENIKRDKVALQEKLEKQNFEVTQLRRQMGLIGPTSPTTTKTRSQSMMSSFERRNTETGGLKRSSSGSNNVKLSVKNLVQSIESAAQQGKASPPLPSAQPPAFPTERRRSIGSSNKKSEPKQPSRRYSNPVLPSSEASKLSHSSTWRKMDESLNRDNKPFSSRYPEPTSLRDRLGSSSGLRTTQTDSVPKEARLYDPRKTLSNIISQKMTSPQKDNKEDGGAIGLGAIGKTSSLHQPLTPTRRASETAEKKDPLAVLVKDRGGSKRNALLKWCQLQTYGYKGIDVTNFSSSWNDGLAFCALIHSYLPQKIPYSELNSQDKRRNFKLAFEAAESVGVPSILDVDDMVAMERPDWQSVMTYVTCLYKHFEG